MVEYSQKSRLKGAALMLLSSLAACMGQLCWKLGGEGSLTLLGAGFALYAIGAGAMIIAYRFASLSLLQPILSVGYILTMLIGHYLLYEEVSPLNIVGVVAIITGVVFVAAGDE